MNTYTERSLLRAHEARKIARRWKAALRAHNPASINVRKDYIDTINRSVRHANDLEFAAYLAAGGIR